MYGVCEGANSRLSRVCVCFTDSRMYVLKIITCVEKVNWMDGWMEVVCSHGDTEYAKHQVEQASEKRESICVCERGRGNLCVIHYTLHIEHVYLIVSCVCVCVSVSVLVLLAHYICVYTSKCVP